MPSKAPSDKLKGKLRMCSAIADNRNAHKSAKGGKVGHIALSEAALVGVISLLAILTSFLFFRHFDNFYTDDSPGYIGPANNLLAGHGFTDANGNPEIERTPGYPLLIAVVLACTRDLKWVIPVQHLFRVLIIVATTLFVFSVSASRMKAFVAGCLLCIDLPLLEAANTYMTEILFTLIFLAVLWLLWTDPAVPGGKFPARCLAAGLLAGACVLVRPVALFFFLPAAAYLFVINRQSRPSQLRAISSFFLAFLSLPCLWAARNYVEAHNFTVSSIAGINMLFYRAAGAMAIDDPGNFNANLALRREQLEKQACDTLEKLYAKPCSEITTSQKDQYYSVLGRRIVLQHKTAYMKLAVRGAGFMVLGGGASRLSELTGLAPEKSRKLLLAYTVPLSILGLVGLWGLWSENRRLFWLISLVVIYFVVISAGAEAYSRLRVPIEPLGAITIATGLELVFRAGFRRRIPA